MDVSYAFILYLWYPVFWPCDKLITRPRSPTVCKLIMKLRNQLYAPMWEEEEIEREREREKVGT
jgi:hypothetical protein